MPFDAEDLAGLFAQIQTQDPVDLRRIAKDVPKALSKIVHRCLSPEPRGRFPDAKSLATALRSQAEALGDEAPVAAVVASNRKLGHRDSVATDSASSAPEAASAQEASMPSLDGLELDLPTSGKAKPKRPRKRRAPAPVESDGDDPFDLAGGHVEMELAVDLPDSSSAQRPRPRAAATGGAGPRSDRGPRSDGRGIQIRGRQDVPGAAGPLVAMIFAGALVVATYLARERLTPSGVVEQQAALGGAVGAAVYAGIAAGSLVATVAIAIAGIKRVAFSLLLATLGYAAVTLGAVAALGLVAAPGVVPPTVTKIGFLAAPWGAIVGCAGLAAFATATARDLRSDPDLGWLAIPSSIGAVVCLGAAGWMASAGATVALEDVQQAGRPAAEPRVVLQAMRFGLALQGATALEIAHGPPAIDAQTIAAAKIAGPAPETSAAPP